VRYLHHDLRAKAVPKYLSGRTSYLWVRLAFHPYPQVIPPVCNLDGFGPPRACSARFTLPKGRSPSFGSVPRDSSPFRTRVRSGSGCPCLSLATQNHSSAHSTKGTPSQVNACSDRLEAHGFRICFTPLDGVLFTVPSRYWFPIGCLRYLALGGGPPRFPPDVTCPAVLTRSHHRSPPAVAYGALTRSGRPFQWRSADVWDLGEGSVAPSTRSVLPPHRQRRLARTPVRFGLLPVRSPLLGESSLLLRVLRCFSSPRAPRIARCPGITPGGLPHSEISGSPAASASPEHFAAWPRPSSAAGTKASTVRPSSRIRSAVIIAPRSRRRPVGNARSPARTRRATPVSVSTLPAE
jgi:hypothetical protein